MTNTNWSCQGTFNGPSVAKPTAKYPAAYAGSIGPFWQWESLAVIGQHPIVSFVFALLNRCRPSAVAGCVSRIIVDAVNRVLRAWTLSHIVIERLKGLSPSLTDRDATTPVLVIALGFVVFASKDHCVPNAILWRFGQTVSNVGSLLFSQEASAACNLQSNQIARTNGSRLSARAIAIPVVMLPAFSGIRNNSETPKGSSKKINESRFEVEASTTCRMTACQIFTASNGCLPALTSAIPMDSRLAVSASNRSNGQPAKLHADKILGSRAKDTLDKLNSSHEVAFRRRYTMVRTGNVLQHLPARLLYSRSEIVTARREVAP